MPVIVDGPENEAPVRLLRLLINDTAADDDGRVFTDADLVSFLALEGENVKRAAAQALDTIADNEALVGKAIRTQDLTTDGPKVADSLRKRAAALRAQADAADDDADGGFFQLVAPVGPRPHAPELTQHRHTAWPC